MIDSVLSHSGILEDTPIPVDETSKIDLRLRVFREIGSLQFVPVASTHASPMVLRDLRRVPDDADRVILRTGDRVRLEVKCDRGGFVTVFNVGPTGTMNLLLPETAGIAVEIHAGTPLLIADIEMRPPAGKERVYAVWSRVPLALDNLPTCSGPGSFFVTCSVSRTRSPSRVARIGTR